MNRVAIWLLLANVAFAGQSGPTSRIGQDRVTVIRHVAVLTMEESTLLPNRDVVVRGDHVAEIRESGVEIPPGALRIDGTGKYLLPGLADMHVHLYDTEGFASYLAYGFTTIANLNGSPSDIRWRGQVNGGALVGPTIYTAGPSINGYPPRNPTFVSVRTENEARHAVDEQVRAGYDFIKVYSMLSAEAYRSLLNEAKEKHIGALGHLPINVDFNEAIQSYQSNVAHMEEIANSYFHGKFDLSLIPDVTAKVARSGMTVTPNLFAYSDYLRWIADPKGMIESPEMQYASPALFSEKLPTHNRSVRPDPAGFAAALKSGHDLFQKLTRSFSDAGVLLLVGTDTEVFGFPGEAGYQEMEELLDAGLTRFQVLTAATRSAGDYIREHVHPSEKFGALKPGYRADMLLLTANPLDDLANLHKIAGVMVRGRWFTREEIDAMRRKKAEENTPLRRAASEIDADVHEGRVAEAVATFRSWHQRAPTKALLAEVVLQEDGAALLKSHPLDALALFQLNAIMYPDSFAAYTDVARAYLAVKDYRNAELYAKKALAISQTNARPSILLDEIMSARRAK